jgi:hypothetical protein
VSLEPDGEGYESTHRTLVSLFRTESNGSATFSQTRTFLSVPDHAIHVAETTSPSPDRLARSTVRYNNLRRRTDNECPTDNSRRRDGNRAEAPPNIVPHRTHVSRKKDARDGRTGHRSLRSNASHAPRTKVEPNRQRRPSRRSTYARTN